MAKEAHMSHVAVPSTFHTIDGVSTNLTAEELTEVIKAVDEKRVVWDEDATYLSDGSAAGAGYCEGKFTYDGRRYLLTEDFEKLASLTRL
jgi:hypothetical protein